MQSIMIGKSQLQTLQASWYLYPKSESRVMSALELHGRIRNSITLSIVFMPLKPASLEEQCKFHCPFGMNPAPLESHHHQHFCSVSLISFLQLEILLGGAISGETPFPFFSCRAKLSIITLTSWITAVFLPKLPWPYH